MGRVGVSTEFTIPTLIKQNKNRVVVGSVKPESKLDQTKARPMNTIWGID